MAKKKPLIENPAPATEPLMVKGIAIPVTPVRYGVMYMGIGDVDEYAETTDENFEDFCSLVMAYMDMFGMADWHVKFIRAENDGKGAACVQYNYDNRDVTFVLGTRLAREFTTGSSGMARLALHEVLHLLFAGWNDIAGRDLPEGEKEELLDAAEHGLIRRLEQVLLAVPVKSGAYRLCRVSSPKKE